METLYRKVEINSEQDLPKENGFFICMIIGIKQPTLLQYDVESKGKYGFTQQWLKLVEYYFQPFEPQEPKQTAEEIKNKIYDKITDDLKGSRLEGLETNDGDKYPLIDFLSSGTTIKEGLSEVHNLVEQIDIDDLLKEYAQNQQPKEIRKVLIQFVNELRKVGVCEISINSRDMIIDKYLKLKDK